MEPVDKATVAESALTAWRKSYLRLRLLERQLVSVARGTGDPSQVEKLYREIEDLRKTTTEMFTVAQIESVSSHVKLFQPRAAPSHAQAFRFSTVSKEGAVSADAVRGAGTRQPPELKTARQPGPAAAGSRPLALSLRSLRAPSPP